VLEARSVAVNLDKHSRVPTVQVNFCKSAPHITFMLDTGSGLNIIKENFVPKNKTVNYNNILKLNGINKYPVYTLGEITLPLFEKEVTFHIVSNDFPISQSGILGNDFFQQTSSKIDYAKGYLDISGINVPFFSPETIIASPRSESLFYVRVANPEVKIGYIPRLKITHGIYLGDTIVENVSGKAYLNVISTLDEETEVQVPTLRLKPLDELFDNHESNIEAQDNQEKVAEMQSCFTHPRDNQIHKEISYDNANLRNNEDVIFEEKFLNKRNQISSEIQEVIENNVQNKGENQTKKKNEILRGNKKMKKNFNLDTHQEDFQIFSQIPDSEIIGEGS